MFKTYKNMIRFPTLIEPRTPYWIIPKRNIMLFIKTNLLLWTTTILSSSEFKILYTLIEIRSILICARKSEKFKWKVTKIEIYTLSKVNIWLWWRRNKNMTVSNIKLKKEIKLNLRLKTFCTTISKLSLLFQ